LSAPAVTTARAELHGLQEEPRSNTHCQLRPK